MLPATISDTYLRVLTRISEGRTVADACGEYDIDPARLWRARKSDPQLQELYDDARELGSEALADSLQNIHETVSNPLMARVVSENRRWLLSRRFRATYGDRLAIEGDGRSDLTDILREAIARIPRPGSDHNTTIDAQTVTLADIFGASDT